MIIGVTLNEVLRDFINQFEYTYEKYIDKIILTESEQKEKDEDGNTSRVKSFNLLDYFKFNSLYDMNKFLYSSASLEIFGHADQKTDNIMKFFNEFVTNILDDEEHEIVIISRESNKSIPGTFFFLSKLSCIVPKVIFVKEYEDKWDYVDVLITANPIALESKPEGKIGFKIKASYNIDTETDFEYNSMRDLIEDYDEFINKIETKKK